MTDDPGVAAANVQQSSRGATNEQQGSRGTTLFFVIRVPYGTHLWQVQDVESMNRAYEHEIRKAKVLTIQEEEAAGGTNDGTR